MFSKIKQKFKKYDPQPQHEIDQYRRGLNTSACLIISKSQQETQQTRFLVNNQQYGGLDMLSF